MKTLSLLERHNLEVGKLPTSLLSQQLWLLRRGELLHHQAEGSLLVYVPSQLPRNILGRQRATGLYSLNKSNWSLALHHLPQLAALTSSDYPIG